MKRRRVRWPNLFVVGAPRAGTTSLWHYLRQHPEVFMSDPKETYFFGSYRPRIVPEVRDQTAYLRLFDRAHEPVAGEATPTYLVDQEAPAQIHARSREARIVISLREPGERAVSTYWHHVRYGVGGGSFVDRVNRELERPEPGVFTFSYADAVERYLERFDRVHVIFLEELRHDVRGHLRRLYEFAGVDPAFADEVDTTPRNPYGVPKNRLVRGLYRSRWLRSSVRRMVPAAFEHRLERALLDGDRQGEVDPVDVERLRAAYADDTRRLEQVLGRPVPWSRG